MKKILLITFAAIGLSFLASSCVKEKGFEDRVGEIVAAQLDSLNKQVAALEKTQTALNDSLKNIKGDVEKLSKQSKDLTDSIAAVKDSLAAQKKWTTEQLDAIGVRLKAIEDKQEVFKKEVYDLLGLLWTRIQKIDVVPEYNDGSVGVGKGDFELSFIVRPDSVAQKLVAAYKVGDSTFKFLAVKTLTKSNVNLDTLDIRNVSYKDGIVSVKINGSGLDSLYYEGKQSYSGSLVINDGNSENTSGFFPLTHVVRYPEAPDSACVKIGSKWWAPVNCGYDADHKYGLLYQCGRKYGQNHSTESPNPTIVEGQYNGENGTEDPQSYYKGTKSDPCDWIVNGSESYWDATGGAEAEHIPLKGNFDPCPSGWRVPTYTELNALFGNLSDKTLDTEGGIKGKRLYGTSSPAASAPYVFLPAAGYRGPDGCKDRPTTCRYLTSSFEFDKVYYVWTFNLQENYKIGMQSEYRNLGCSVRCVQE